MSIEVCRPLKIENPASGGVNTDMYPTETNPNTDYLNCLGVAFGSALVASITESSNIMNFSDAITTSPITLTQLYTAVNNTFNNSTDGWVATNVQAAIEEAPIHLRAGEVSSSAAATSTTGDQVMTGMTFTPAAGTYLVWFSCDLNSPTAGSVASISLFIATTQVVQSLRKIMPFAGGTLTVGNQRVGASTNGLLTVNGSQAISLHWSSSTAGITVADRTLNYLRCT